MAGGPQRREKLKAAEAATDDVKVRLDAVRLALIRDGIDPNKYDAEAAKFEPPCLTGYLNTLPLAVARLASDGKSIEEIRIALGFTTRQEAEWSELYVAFYEALARVREREQAFWAMQARQAAKTGDRPGFAAISALIQKKFADNAGASDAVNLLHLRPGHRRDQPVLKDE